MMATIAAVLFSYFLFIASGVREKSEFTIVQGEPVSSVAQGLGSAGLIRSRFAFRVSLAAFGGRVQAGDYDLPRGASVWRIARMFARGDIAGTTYIIPEGMTVKQIFNLLECEKCEVQSANDLPREARRQNSIEPCALQIANYRDGELFPDTYRVPRGTSCAAVLNLMKKKMDSIRIGWENSGRHAPAPLKTWDEIITLASIVQKETPKVSEMPIVASVYLNRLRKKMRLQADPTAVYAITGGLGDMRGKTLWSNHLKFDSPYNTYVHYGLPPAPIANVGSDAIRAVLNPADTNYLFFVADGQGGHNFSRTLKEHNAHRANWREIKKSKK